MTYSAQAQFETLTVVAAGSVTTSYVAAVTFSHPVVMFAIKNGTNGDVIAGIDGSTAKWGFPAVSGSAYDVAANHPQVTNLMLKANSTIYIKWQGSAPGTPTGNVYIEAMEIIP